MSIQTVMADLLSIVASVLTVAEATIVATSKLSQLLSAFKNAKSRRQRIQNGVNDLRNVLERVETLVTRYKDLPVDEHPVWAFNDIHKAVESCQEELQTLEADVLDGRSPKSTSAMVRLKFTIKEKRCEELLRAFESRKLTLVLAMQALDL